MDARSRRSWWVVLALMLLAGIAGTAQANMRCDGRLISVGDHMYDVLRLCGEPHFRITGYPYYPYFGYGLVPNEEWQYNFGPQRLIRIVHFQGNRVSHLETGGYGFDPAAERRCRPGDIRVDLTVLELLARCGEPDFPEVHVHHYPYPMPGRPDILMAVPVKQWIYDFGPRYFYRIVTITGGRVSDVRTGQRGHAPAP